MATTKVRTTIEPGVVREVDTAELTDLHRQGILYSFERSEVTDAIVGKASPIRWKDAEKAADIVTAPAPLTATNTDTKEL